MQPLLRRPLPQNEQTNRDGYMTNAKKSHRVYLCSTPQEFLNFFLFRRGYILHRQALPTGKHSSKVLRPCSERLRRMDHVIWSNEIRIGIRVVSRLRNRPDASGRTLSNARTTKLAIVKTHPRQFSNYKKPARINQCLASPIFQNESDNSLCGFSG